MSKPVTLSGKSSMHERRQSGAKTLGFELDILGEPVPFDLEVADRSARLADIAPLAQTVSTRLCMATLDRLRTKGSCVPCRKGCSACCSYLVPLSVPETFRIAEELRAMPADESRPLMQSSLDTARTILERMPSDFEVDESATANDGIRSKQLGDWYAGLGLACPFLSDGLCVPYEQRPIACREHMVTSPETSCDIAGNDEPDAVKMPVSVLECLGQLTAELEDREVEAVMLPLALPWTQENVERSRRTWPAVDVVERFVEILQATANAPAAAL